MQWISLAYRNSSEGAHVKKWVWWHDSSHLKFNNDKYFKSSKSPLKDPCENFGIFSTQWSSIIVWFFMFSGTHKNISFRWDLGNDWFPSNFNYSFVRDFDLYLVPVCISWVFEESKGETMMTSKSFSEWLYNKCKNPRYHTIK